MRLPRTLLLAGLLLAGCAGGTGAPGTPAAGTSVTLGASLSGDGLQPPSGSAGKGTLLATLTATGVLNWELRTSGLSGPATALRLYDGGRPVPGLAGLPAQGPARGTLRLDAAQQATLVANRWSAAVATAAYPGGEIGGAIRAAE